MSEQEEELEALVISVLTTSLKEHPNGLPLPLFEKKFPAITDEPDDWYKSYKKKNVLEALQSIKSGSIRLGRDRSGTIAVALNHRSDKVDQHLVDLVSNQKSSSKRKRNPHSNRPHFQRVLDSFAINQRYTNTSHHGGNRLNACLRLEAAHRNDSSSNRRASPASRPYRMSMPSNDQQAPRQYSSDPRSRSSVQSSAQSSHQARPPPASAGYKSPSTGYSSSKSLSSQSTPSTPPTRSQSHQVAPPSASKPAAATPVQVATTRVPERIPDDPTLDHKKSYLRQRLLHMLTKKYTEIKLLFLDGVYETEYSEKIDPLGLGYPSLSKLLQDAFFSEYIKINYVPPLVTVSARNICHEKENIGNNDGNRSSYTSDPREVQSTKAPQPMVDKSNHLTNSRAKYNAIEMFNVKPMLESLSPLGNLTEPPLGNSKLEDCIKYRTLRLIKNFTIQKKEFKLDDWELAYEQESQNKNRVQLRDYGFRTLLEFFKILAIELPISIRLNAKNEWVAVSDLEDISKWITEKLSEGRWRAATVDSRCYELVAFPNESFTWSGLKDIPKQEFYPAIVMSVKSPHRMWIQLRTTKRIEDHLTIEGSLVCYEDLASKFMVPSQFIVPGFPCVAYDKTQQRWCRAVIVRVPQVIEKESLVSIFLVDYGIPRNVSIAQLRCIRKTHLRHPVGLIYAKLHNVDEQSTHSKRVLQEFTNPPVTLGCRIVSMVEFKKGEEGDCWPRQCFFVTLIDTSKGSDCNLANVINNYSRSPDE